MYIDNNTIYEFSPLRNNNIPCFLLLFFIFLFFIGFMILYIMYRCFSSRGFFKKKNLFYYYETSNKKHYLISEFRINNNLNLNVRERPECSGGGFIKITAGNSIQQLMYYANSILNLLKNGRRRMFSIGTYPLIIILKKPITYSEKILTCETFFFHRIVVSEIELIFHELMYKMYG